MYRQSFNKSIGIKGIKCYNGETIEEKVYRITVNKEPIKDGAPLIYVDRDAGVQAGYNIRTDRFEVAVEAMDKVTKSHVAKREQKAKTLGEQAQEGMKKEGGGETGGQSIQGTGNQ